MIHFRRIRPAIILAAFLSLSVILFADFFMPKKTEAASFKVQLEVAVCNANLACEPEIGEDYHYCPSDCEAPPPPPPDPTPTGPNIGGSQTGGGYYGGGFGSWNSTNTATQQPQTAIPPLPIKKPNTQTVTASSSAPSSNTPASGIDGRIRISPFANRALLDFGTFYPSLLTISWGKTPSYEMGISGDSAYRKNFSKELSNLEPGTRYYYHIELLDTLKRVTTYDGAFLTASSDSKAQLPVIIDFSEKQGARPDELEFSWGIKAGFDTVESMIDSIAANEDADTVVSESDRLERPFVRLTRSEFYFPMDPYEGKVVYEGSGSHAVDSGLVDGHSYFYSIFMMDKKGNHSNPAIIFHLHDNRSDSQQSPKNNAKTDVYDPLLDDEAGLILDQAKEDPVGPDAYPIDCLGTASRSGTSIPFMRFSQDGGEISSAFDPIEADGTKSLLIRVGSQGLDDSDVVSMCFYSYEKERWNHYILSKKSDGSRELIFPQLSSVTSGKLHYQFAIGVLKYKGEIEIVRKGNIIFDIPEKKTNSIAKVLGFSTASLIIILSILRWIKVLFARQKFGR